MKLTVSIEAGRDLEGIYDFTSERWGVVQADRYAESFERALEALLESVAHGSRHARERSGYARVRNGSHFIFYRVLEDAVHIERVLHERMDALRHLP